MSSSASRLARVGRQQILDAFATGPPVRKPWVMLNTVRSHLEKELDLPGPLLLRALIPFFEEELKLPPKSGGLVLGQAYVSGNLYLGCLIPNYLSPSMCLIANVFSHGELGIDFLSKGKEGSFFHDDVGLLKELQTYDKLRIDFGHLPDEEVEEMCLNDKSTGPGEVNLSGLTGGSSSSSDSGSSSSTESGSGSESSETSEGITTRKSKNKLKTKSEDKHGNGDGMGIVKGLETPKRKLMRRKMFQQFPFISEAPYFGSAGSGSTLGNDKGCLLQHPGYADNTTDEFRSNGTTNEAKLKDYAEFMSKQGYVDRLSVSEHAEPVDDSTILGAALMVNGSIFGGARLGSRLTALQTVCVQMLASGYHPTQVQEVALYTKSNKEKGTAPVQGLSARDLAELGRWNPEVKIYCYDVEGDLNPGPLQEISSTGGGGGADGKEKLESAA